MLDVLHELDVNSYKTNEEILIGLYELGQIRVIS